MAKLWLKHEIKANEDLRIVGLIKKHKATGYGVYWLFNEMLAKAQLEGETIDMSKPYVREGIAEKMKMEVEEIMPMLETMIALDLLQEKDGIYSSVALDKRIEPIKSRHEIAKKAADARWADRKKKKEQPVSKKKGVSFDDDDEHEGETHHSVHVEIEQKPKKKKTKKEVTFEKTDEFFKNDSFNKAFDKFVEMRKEVKKPMTDYAKELLIGKVRNLSEDQVEVASAILNQSTQSSWTDVYALSEENKPKSKEKKGHRNDSQ